MAAAHDAQKRELCKILFAQGMSQSQIAKHTSLPDSTISTWSVEDEWMKLRNPESGELRGVAESIAAELLANRQSYTQSWGKTAKKLADHAQNQAPDKVLGQAKNYAAIHGIVKDVFELGQPETVLNVGILNDSLPGADISEAQVIDIASSPNGS